VVDSGVRWVLPLLREMTFRGVNIDAGVHQARSTQPFFLILYSD